jgi:hypothetical protein
MLKQKRLHSALAGNMSLDHARRVIAAADLDCAFAEAGAADLLQRA